jgi:hypothetical protein
MKEGLSQAYALAIPSGERPNQLMRMGFQPDPSYHLFYFLAEESPTQTIQPPPK